MNDKPIRIQRKRTKGWKMPENTVYVGRPSIFGNPFTPKTVWGDVPYLLAKKTFKGFQNQDWDVDKEVGLDACLKLFKTWAIENLTNLEMLRGKNLACWCKEGEPCHADVLLELANKEK